MTDNMDDELLDLDSDLEDCVEPSVTETKFKIDSKSFTDEGLFTLNQSHSMLSGNSLTCTKRSAPSNIEEIPHSKKLLLTNEMISSVPNGVPFTKTIQMIQQNKKYSFVQQGNVLKRLVVKSTNNGASKRNKLLPMVGQFKSISTVNDIRLPTVSVTPLASSHKNVMPIISDVFSLFSAVADTNTTTAMPLKQNQRVTLSIIMPKPCITTSATKTSSYIINNQQSVSSEYKEVSDLSHIVLSSQQEPSKSNISSSLQSKKSFSADISSVDSSSKLILTPKHTNKTNCVEEIIHSRKANGNDTKLMKTLPKLDKPSSRSTKLKLEVMDVKELKKPCNCTESQCLEMNCSGFENGTFCYKCNCFSCFNNIKHKTDRTHAIREVLNKNPNAFKPKINEFNNYYKLEDNNECLYRKSSCIKNNCDRILASLSCNDKLNTLDNDHPGSQSDERLDLNSKSDNAVVSDSVQSKNSIPRKVFKFLTDDIVRETCSRLLAIGMKTKQSNGNAEECQLNILLEFGLCLDKIINTVLKKS